jgi:hypothetical protein
MGTHVVSPCSAPVSVAGTPLTLPVRLAAKTPIPKQRLLAHPEATAKEAGGEESGGEETDEEGFFGSNQCGRSRRVGSRWRH